MLLNGMGWYSIESDRTRWNGMVNSGVRCYGVNIMVWYGMGRDVMAWDGNVPGAMRFYSMLRCSI